MGNQFLWSCKSLKISCCSQLRRYISLKYGIDHSIDILSGWNAMRWCWQGCRRDLLKLQWCPANVEGHTRNNCSKFLPPRNSSQIGAPSTHFGACQVSVVIESIELQCRYLHVVSLLNLSTELSSLEHRVFPYTNMRLCPSRVTNKNQPGQHRFSVLLLGNPHHRHLFFCRAVPSREPCSQIPMCDWVNREENTSSSL